MKELSQLVIQFPKQKHVVPWEYSQGVLRRTRKADEIISVYAEYQRYAKDALDISGVLKPYEEAIL